MRNLHRSFMKSFLMLIFVITLLLLIFVLGPMSALYGAGDLVTHMPNAKKMQRSNVTFTYKPKQNSTHKDIQKIIMEAVTQVVVKESGARMWGGRFDGKISQLMEKFGDSIAFDQRLYSEDLEGSGAYAKSITRIGLLTRKECRNILDGLDRIAEEWSNKTFVLKPGDEDIHTANERRLTELIGPAAKKLHTGRSRNDQVATDLRMWLKKAIIQNKAHLFEFLDVIVERAEKESDVLLPGYTHLQRAQPVRWSHWLLSYGWKIKRDIERLSELFVRADQLPLGSGALAGNPFAVDRDFLAKELDFSSVSPNSMDAVGDRDFVLEYLSWASITAIHFSQLAEDLILYSSEEFDFVEISDAFSTGSSLMPQKKNPDSLELIRSKAGRVFGHYAALMTSMKGLPSTYNRDLQEDKEALFDVYDTLTMSLPIASGVLSSLKIHRTKMEGALTEEMLSTDLAYYLVRKGVPFRKAHTIVGACVLMGKTKRVSLSKLKLSDLKSLSPLFDHDVESVWNYQNSVEQYSSTGGTSSKSVQTQIDQLNKWIIMHR